MEKKGCNGVKGAGGKEKRAAKERKTENLRSEIQKN